MKILKRTNRFYHIRPDGYPQIRVYHKRGSGKKMPRYLLKCGCCDQHIEIYYDREGLEINGVNGSIEDWREILLPLLQNQRRLSLNKGKEIRRNIKDSEVCSSLSSEMP